MNEESMKAFLQQFAASRKQFDELPSWMKESAKVASASFPKVRRQAEQHQPDLPATLNVVQVK